MERRWKTDSDDGDDDDHDEQPLESENDGFAEDVLERTEVLIRIKINYSV
jgi:hypothetical protein